MAINQFLKSSALKAYRDGRFEEFLAGIEDEETKRQLREYIEEISKQEQVAVQANEEQDQPLKAPDQRPAFDLNTDIGKLDHIVYVIAKRGKWLDLDPTVRQWLIEKFIEHGETGRFSLQLQILNWSVEIESLTTAEAMQINQMNLDPSERNLYYVAASIRSIRPIKVGTFEYIKGKHDLSTVVDFLKNLSTDTMLHLTDAINMLRIIGAAIQRFASEIIENLE